MRILFCINNTYYTGGGQRVLVQRINYLKKNTNHEIYVVTTDQKNKENFYKIESGIKKIDLGINYNEYKNKNLIEKVIKFIIKRRQHLNKMEKLVEKLKPDIIVGHGTQEKWILYKLKFKCKKILEAHVSKKMLFRQREGKIKRIINYVNIYYQEKLINKYDEFIVLNDIEKIQWKKHKVKVISNPLSFYSAQVSDLENKKVISVGRLEYEKGFDILIEVWKLVVDKHKDWILEIYGEGSLKEELEKKIKKLKLENNLFLKGLSNNIKEKYLESSICVISSRTEGFGMVLIEAMTCGLPLVSFDCPFGPKTIISDGIDGFLCENENVGKMAERINYLIEEKEVRKSFGKKAKEHSSRYEIKKIMDQWIELLQN